MTQQIFDPMQGKDLLKQVRTGMRVYAREGKQVGRVAAVSPGIASFAEVEPEGPPGPEVIPGVEQPGGGLGQAIEETMDPVEELQDDRQALLRERGFLRLEGPGLKPASRYILPNQIESVAGQEVHLNLSHQELVQE